MAGCNQFDGLCFDCLSADRDKHRLHADTDTQYLACQLLRIPVHGLPDGHKVSEQLLVCKDFLSLLLMKLSLAGYEILGCKFFSLKMLNIGPHSLLACSVYAERSAVSLMGSPLWVT